MHRGFDEMRDAQLLGTDRMSRMRVYSAVLYSFVLEHVVSRERNTEMVAGT